MPSLPVLDPASVPEWHGSAYPESLRARLGTRGKRPLGTVLGLTHFGVNLTRLAPGACSALRHWHSHEDEFVYVLEGEVTLVTDAGEQVLGAGMAAGFAAGLADGHHLINRTDRPALYLEVGDRSPDDEVRYPDDDLVLARRDGVFRRTSGEPY
ncbi:MAG TPA: cupin domain-containing protein [Candidatus Nitrosopolaris sp.]|nr:cupin domain-containing protein [Candidatus Nitrosopolaris sp.]